MERELDRSHAQNAACDAYWALEALQSTETWSDLPHDARVALCRAHALLGTVIDEVC